MKLQIPSGKYVLALSGGVDSMVLLDLVKDVADIEIVVAHFDHGIREASAADALFVKSAAKDLGVEFEMGQGNLGPDASEDKARQARYEYLRNVKDKYEASGIITAHHQDDLIESALINILRGTGARGLISMPANKEILRPLLGVSKKEILDYATSNNIRWVEDSSNQDVRYLRNNIRKILSEKLNNKDREEILNYVNQLIDNQNESDELLSNLNGHLFEDKATLKRSSFIFLPNEVAGEVLVRWFRQHKISTDRSTVNRIIIVIKTGRPNTIHNINKEHRLKLGVSDAYLTRAI